MTIRPACLIAALGCAVALAQPSPDVAEFLETHCTSCHDDVDQKGGLDLTSVVWKPENPANFATWVKIHDRVASGEMPPRKKKRPESAELQAFLGGISSDLTKQGAAAVAREGRATKRRLNRFEYENTLRDLLSLPYLDVKDFLPEDTEANGFNKTGEALDVSHVQMARYLKAADYALRQAIVPQVEQPAKTVKRFPTWNQDDFVRNINQVPARRRTYPMQGLELKSEFFGKGIRDLRMQDQKIKDSGSIGILMSTYEPTEIRFGGFKAPVSGRYRLRVSANSFWIDNEFTTVSAGRRPEPVTLYADTPPDQLRKLGSFDVGVKPTVGELDVLLLAGETIRPDAARLYRPRPMAKGNPNGDESGMPGVAFQWLEVEGPFLDSWPPAGQRLLFGDLPFVAGKDGVEIASKNPEQDAARLLREFMRQAYRGPFSDSEVERFLGLVRRAMKDGFSFTDAMIAGYSGVLCSPEFLYLDEKPGRLDDFALAERLSYFLWNSKPDETLRQLAETKRLHQTAILQQQTERLLKDPRSQRFVNAFLDYWLDLRHIAGSAPDAELYPEYQLDDLLVESMTAETQLFFSDLLKRNQGVTNLVGSDFAMLNERLAKLYDIPGVDGVTLRPVKLPPDSVRGGLLTQASVLKVTSNGTTTSPVMRGAWIMARLLGKPAPPPPASIPAVEPDTRGVTTIREQLEKHRTEESCNACHRNIDPPGFALESFDVMGAWRDRYRSLGEGEPVAGVGHNAQGFNFRLGPAVDASGQMPGGPPFADVKQLRGYLLQDPALLATNLVKQLAVYATGAPVGFSDRPLVDGIVERSKASGYGVRTLVHALVQSDFFLNK